MVKFKNITRQILIYAFLSTLIFSANILSCKNSGEIVPPESKPSVVSHFGKLRVEGSQIVDKNGDPVVLRGMSLFWSQWIPKYYNEECIRWLRDDWKCTIIRAALAFDNIAYTLHFYTGTHRQSLRNKAIFAINSGLPLFVTEWGLSEASGTGEIDYVETNLWLEFVDLYQLSWCNWSIADKDESSAALKPGTDANGNWENLDLTPSGLFIREEIRSKNSEIFNLINNPE